MDTKGDIEEMTYPNVCFMVDNFDEVHFINPMVIIYLYMIISKI
jgi:hypothetical protein